MIELKDIVVKFGDFEALHNMNANVQEGEFFTFLGPSGCGKTTTLRTITCFIESVSGTVSVNTVDALSAQTPFGGMKASGLGRELGPDAAEHFTETKNVFFATDEA